MINNAHAQPSAPLEPIKIIAFGDSLTAGYGMNPEEAFPAQLEEILKKRGFQVSIINEGVSGDTTESAMSRMDKVLSHSPKYVLLELGANDGLRQLSTIATKERLAHMIKTFQAKNITVILLGMKMPVNQGRGFVKEYNAIFPDLAKEYKLAFYPFFLDSVVKLKEMC